MTADQFKKFVEQGAAAQEAADRELNRQDLQILVLGLQLTIEHTNEDDTRTRTKDLLKAAQRLQERIDMKVHLQTSANPEAGA